MFNKTILNAHAILVIGKDSLYEEELRKEITNLSRDERFFNLTTFGIDESHELTRLSNTLDRPTTFFVNTSLITSEAQNALLKLTEEPSKNLQIIIVVPSDQNILQTFKSRFRVVAKGGANDQISFDVKNFLHSSIPLRLKMFEPHMEHPEDESETKIRKEFFFNLLNVFHHEFLSTKNEEGLRVLSEIDRYGGMTAPSYRMLLEYLAINLPTSLKK